MWTQSSSESQSINTQHLVSLQTGDSTLADLCLICGLINSECIKFRSPYYYFPSCHISRDPRKKQPSKLSPYGSGSNLYKQHTPEGSFYIVTTPSLEPCAASVDVYLQSPDSVYVPLKAFYVANNGSDTYTLQWNDSRTLIAVSRIACLCSVIYRCQVQPGQAH